MLAFGDHGDVGDVLPADGGDFAATLAGFATAGVDVGALGAKLQVDGAVSFNDSWNQLIGCVEAKTGSLGATSEARDAREHDAAVQGDTPALPVQ